MIYNYGKIAGDALGGFGSSLLQAGQARNQMQIQDEQRQRQQQQDKEVQGLAELYATNPTTEQLYQYGLQNPAAYQKVADTIGFKSDQTRQIMQDTLIGALNNPEQKDEIVRQGAEAITAAGGNPQNLISSVGEDFGDFEKGAIPFLASLGGQGANFAKSYMSMKPQAQKPMSEYQAKQLKGKEEDRALRKQEIELRRLESEAKRAKTDEERQIKSEQIKQKKAENEELKAKDQLRIENGIVTAKQNQKAIDDLLNNSDYMDSVTGILNYSKVPESLRTTTQQEASAYLDNIKNSMTIDNLNVMSGPLTDKDIQIIASASSRLREGMSEDALSKELNTIKKAYDRVISNYQKEANRKGYSQKSEISDDELLGYYL